MRVYLDVCCLSRPFDDQTQERIRIESEAVTLVMDWFAKGSHSWASSQAVEDEVLRNPDAQQAARVMGMLEHAQERLELTTKSIERARELVATGFKAMDALHLALAEIHGCDILLTTDDGLVRRAQRIQAGLRVKVANPASWVLEVLNP